MIIKENFRRATAELVILHLLLKEDLYAYEIAKKIDSSGKGLFTLPEGTLYPIMYRLTSKGLVSEFTRVINKRMRRYYHLEKEGLEYYRTMLKEYKLIVQGVTSILEEGGEQDD